VHQGRHLADALTASCVYCEFCATPPFAEAVAELSAAQAASDPGHGLASVWATVNHIRFWHQVSLRQLRHEPVDFAALGAVDGWPALPDERDDAAWEEVVAQTMALNAEIVALIESMSERQLDEVVAAGHLTRWQIVDCLVTHNAYHTSSIISARRVLGLWRR
jgi:uncharacterized damage-inducible protein DinB